MMEHHYGFRTTQENKTTILGQGCDAGYARLLGVGIHSIYKG